MIHFPPQYFILQVNAPLFSALVLYVNSTLNSPVETANINKLHMKYEVEHPFLLICKHIK